MKVELMAYILNPEVICAKAMRGCRIRKAAFELNLKKPAEYYIRLAKKMGHLSVLEHASFVFSVKGISRACSHQLVRHRIASYSQQSQRAVDPIKSADWYVIPPELEGEVKRFFINEMNEIARFYKDLINYGVPKEDARFVLPNACKTNIVVTMNARELLHFFRLRLHPSAQWEIRSMAQKMLDIVKPLAPVIFEDVE